ncbi:MAG: hypothetical protein U5K43_14385 [Halofilum sp. (in: g-proteobacteria)]|nr:hypothetical protein [Halofilum sp. (in: g-proteobacteria)]
MTAITDAATAAAAAGATQAAARTWLARAGATRCAAGAGRLAAWPRALVAAAAARSRRPCLVAADRGPARVSSTAGLALAPALAAARRGRWRCAPWPDWGQRGAPVEAGVARATRVRAARCSTTPGRARARSRWATVPQRRRWPAAALEQVDALDGLLRALSARSSWLAVVGAAAIRRGRRSCSTGSPGCCCC